MWGGINYWDTVASDFYSEQFIDLKEHPDDVEIFKRGMNFGIGDGSEQTFLPMTTFIFEKCRPPRHAAVFAKNQMPNVQQTNKGRNDFYDLGNGSHAFIYEQR